MKNQVLLFVLSVILATSCGVVEKGDPLTDEQVVNYIKVYKSLREAAPGILEKINADPENPAGGQEGFNTFEEKIKEGGLKDYPDFVMLNAKIGSIFSIIQATHGMDKFTNLHNSSNDMLEQGIAEYQKIIDDPEMPEEVKESAREGIAELKKGQSELNDDWSNNKVWADFVLEKTKEVAGLIVDEADIEVVKRHEKEILEAYVGFPMPELPDGRMPELKFE